MENSVNWMESAGMNLIPEWNQLGLIWLLEWNQLLNQITWMESAGMNY